MSFEGLQRGHYRAILADPPWDWKSWRRAKGMGDAPPTERDVGRHYDVMDTHDIANFAVRELAADDCVLFMWATWPLLPQALEVIRGWGFEYKTCAFDWMKADPYRLFADDATPQMGMGYWTRSNTEPCLLATVGKPKRQDAGIRQGIIAPRREHSRKPDEIHGRIERLVAGPYLELFARQTRPGWDCWGNQTTKFNEAAE